MTLGEMKKKVVGYIPTTTIGRKPSGGIHLPPIAEADNGKVLAVVNGKWQLVNIGMSANSI